MHTPVHTPFSGTFGTRAGPFRGRRHRGKVLIMTPRVLVLWLVAGMLAAGVIAHALLTGTL